MNALTLDQRQVDFYGDEITAVLVDHKPRPEIYVPLRPIVEFLGMDWAGQYQRLQRDPILSDVAMSVGVTTTDIDPESRRPHSSEMLALPLKFLPGFLFGINANRVRDELRERILRYQRECYDVLWEAFQDGRLTADRQLDELLQQHTDTVATYKMLQAMARMARNQVLLEARLAQHDQGLEDTRARLDELETLLDTPQRAISAAQATRISQAVKAIAMQLSKRSGRNEYGGVYGELYRRFQIPGYRELPASRFEEAINWLTDWWQQISDDGVPF